MNHLIIESSHKNKQEMAKARCGAGIIMKQQRAQFLLTLVAVSMFSSYS